MAVSNLVSSSLSASDLITQPQLPVLGVNTVAASTVSIGSLPSTYRTLRVWFQISTNDGNSSPWFRLNNDNAGIYRWVAVGASGGQAAVFRGSSSNALLLPQVLSGQNWSGYIDIYDYSSSTSRKFMTGMYGGTGSAAYAYQFSATWVPTSNTSVTSVDWTSSSGLTLSPSDFFVMGAK